LGLEFKAIFFDLDGTLVDIHGPLYVAARRALEALGHKPMLTRERYEAAVAGQDLWFGVPDEIRADYVKLAFMYLVAELDQTERLEVLPHVRETLSILKERDYATAVITSRPGEAQRLVEKLAMVGLAPLLDQVITQKEATLAALDKTESLRVAARRAEVRPCECMYVGDEPRDIMAAAGAGFGAAVAVATGPANFDLLCRHPQHRPDLVLRSMGELVDLIDRVK
jgi:phosphoglycolate phosphatase-like HAD superfamily hydrolase